jgi:hypothetical protein
MNTNVIGHNVTISYGSGEVSYEINKVAAGIYSAYLIYYDGKDNPLPPLEITLLRGVRHWTGSCENGILLNSIGLMIEKIFYN